MPTSRCPNCGTTQETPGGVAGFRCRVCQTDVQRVRCTRCSNVVSLYGPVTGGGALELRCPNCRRRMVVSKQQLRAINAEARRAARAITAAERQAAMTARDAKAAHARAKELDCNKKNAALRLYVAELEGLLNNSLDSNERFSFASLRLVPALPPFVPGDLGREESSPSRDRFLPTKPSGLAWHLPGAKKRYEGQLLAAEAQYDNAVAAWKDREDRRRKGLAAAKEKYEAEIAKAKASAAAHNRSLDDLEQRCRKGDPRAVVDYFAHVLSGSHYPEGFPRQARLAYTRASRQLVLELELPTLKVVPDVKEYRYIKSRDEIIGSPLAASTRRTLYTSIIAQLALRTISEILRADEVTTADTVVLNGHVDTTDERTGRPIHPCLVTVRATRDQFLALDLRNVDPVACLKGLSASLSRSPAELTPVRPVLEFDMVDPRFVQEADVLSTLDTRPNLMDLSPKEFESLITNLFEKMGLETRLTQPSRDGGVDCVAYDPRPIFGGKVVIQAKRYKNTVGVSSVRDLFGTMQNEGASKGILVTTSGYGQASHEFANGKPLELLDGGNLLYLLHENAGIDAKIEVPEDWVDPDPDR